MKIRVKGKQVDVAERECKDRKCLRPVEWKGIIWPGVGYQYAPKSQWHWECGTRAAKGCPPEF